MIRELAIAVLLQSGLGLTYANPTAPPLEKLLDRLNSLHSPIKGMHDTLGGIQKDGYSTVAKLCGTSPRLWSSDFGFSTHPNDSIRLRNNYLNKARIMSRQGVVITLSWHQCNPTINEPCTFLEGVQKPLSDSDWKELLNDGSSLNMRWKSQLDLIAKYLKILRDEGVVVLFRPLHEANIPGFWWSHNDPALTKSLWKKLREYFTNYHNLNNLLWVWSVSYHPKYWGRVSAYYPGDDLVDVLAVDIYPPFRDMEPPFELVWDTLIKISNKKPIALAEVSRLPSMQGSEKQNWAYIVPWGKNMLIKENSITEICRFYNNR